MSKTMILKSTRFLLIAVMITDGLTLYGGDWPQILGPNRDGVAVGEVLHETWPSNGPVSLWSMEVGQGFAGVAVANDVVVLFHRVENQEIAVALNAESGKRLWSQAFPCSYRSGISSDAGPRCVPLVAGGRVFLFGVEGQLRCLDLQLGKQIWHRDTREDFSAVDGYFGAGSTPVVFDDRIIVNVGGREGASVVAFATTDGRTLWQAFNDAASYSSPVIAEVENVRHAICVTRLNVVSLDPADGSVRFTFPFGARGPTVNGATPVIVDDHLFVTASYRVGSVWASIADGAKERVNTGERLLASQYATPIRADKLLFAVDGRQDIGTATLKCIDPEASKVLWEKGGFDYGSLLRVGREIVFLTSGGELIRFGANSEQYTELHRSRILNPTPDGYRLPALSNGRLFVRDDRQLKCLDVGSR